MSEELKAVVAESQKLLVALRDADAARTAEAEKYGKETGETRELIGKLDERMGKAEQYAEKLERDLKLAAAHIGAAKAERAEKAAAHMSQTAGRTVTAEQAMAHEQAFHNWMRYGKQGMDPEERKNLVEDTTGELLVVYDLDETLYRVLPQLNVIRSMAASRQTAKDRLRARSLTELSVAWGKLETGTTITTSSGTPAESYMYVEDLYGLSKIGEDELMDSDFALDAYVASSFGIQVANTEESAFAQGAGHGSLQPAGFAIGAVTGFDQTSPADTTSVHTDGTVDLAELMALPYTVKAQYAQRGAYIVHRATTSKMRVLKDTTGRFLWQQGGVTGGGIERQPNTFDGYPVAESYGMPQFPTATTAGVYPVVFADFGSGYLVLDRLGMTIQRLNELYAESGLVGFKTHRRVGGGVIRGEAFARLKATHV